MPSPITPLRSYSTSAAASPSRIEPCARAAGCAPRRNVPLLEAARQHAGSSRLWQHSTLPRAQVGRIRPAASWSTIPTWTLPSCAAMGVEGVDFETLLAEQIRFDTHAAHCGNLSPHRRGGLAAHEARAMLINTARGPVVDEAALVKPSPKAGSPAQGSMSLRKSPPRPTTPCWRSTPLSARPTPPAGCQMNRSTSPGGSRWKRAST